MYCIATTSGAAIKYTFGGDCVSLGTALTPGVGTPGLSGTPSLSGTPIPTIAYCTLNTGVYSTSYCQNCPGGQYHQVGGVTSTQYACGPAAQTTPVPGTACAGIGAEDLCGPNMFCSYGGNNNAVGVCVTEFKDGSICTNNYECASGKCDGFKCQPAKATPGQTCDINEQDCGPDMFCGIKGCALKEGTNSSCVYDFECKSGDCNLYGKCGAAAGDSHKAGDTCTILGENDNCGADMYCSVGLGCQNKGKGGDLCGRDNQCKSGKCHLSLTPSENRCEGDGGSGSATSTPKPSVTGSAKCACRQCMNGQCINWDPTCTGTKDNSGCSANTTPGQITTPVPTTSTSVEKCTCTTCNGTKCVAWDPKCTGKPDDSACAKTPTGQVGTPANQKYACDTLTGKCGAKADGAYTLLAQCQNNCKATGCAATACVPGQTRGCSIGVAGQNGTQTCIKDGVAGASSNCGYWGDCKVGGSASPTVSGKRYGCDTKTGQCSEVAGGAYTLLAQCQNNCRSNNPTNPPGGGGGVNPTNPPGGGGGSDHSPAPTRPSGIPSNIESQCKVCPSDFKCYQKDGEYKWFVTGYAMQGFTTIADATCTQKGVVKPTYKGKVKGDANCDGYITVDDYSTWHKEYYEGNKGTVVKKTWEADFTGPNGKCDGKVTVDDYSLWHKFFYELKGNN
jgi:hypothetical protein